MAHCMPRGVEALQIDARADLDDVTCTNAAVHVGYAPGGVPVRDDLCFRCGDHARVAADMIAVFVRIQDLRNAPAPVFCDGQTLAEIERVDRERPPFFGTGNDVIEIAIRVSGPAL